MIKLKYSVQNYAWGNIGNQSEVYNLLCENGDDESDQSLPYAELWLGTHESGPSMMVNPKGSLANFIKDNPVVMGNKVIEKFGNKLPFLLKVLSIKTALSLQIHPNKKEAEFLHKCAPTIYKDDNHKPELAIALTDFEALVGFRSLKEITLFMHSIPQLGQLIGNVRKEYMKLIDEEQRKSALKVCYKALMMSPEDKVKMAIMSLVNDFENGKAEQYLTNDHKHLADLFLRLNSQYPNDIGVFSVFLLNWVHLKPGESIFLSANLPHAYISGNIVECMACSDNVIRAGLTPKFKDVETLISMINYTSYGASETFFKPISISSDSPFITRLLFQPPVPDFMVEKMDVAPCATPQSIERKFSSGSIMIIVEGNGTITTEVDSKSSSRSFYKRGNAFFFSFDAVVAIQASNSTIAYRAYVNI